jgi:hypothetical protein
MIKAHYMHVCKYHSVTPLYNEFTLVKKLDFV